MMSDPPAQYSKPELDSILSENGAMPAARFSIRLRAFLLDWLFVSIFVAMLSSFVVPQLFPGTDEELRAWFQEVIDWFGQSGFSKGIAFPEQSETLKDRLFYTQLASFLAFWAYFSIAEALFSGYTFGKSICRLRTINIITMSRPFAFSTIARSGIKAIALLYPAVLIATIIAIKFNKRGQMGHDLLCRTAVVDERYLSNIDQIR